MSFRPALPDPTDRATQRDEDAQYYRGILHELVEMATDIAHAVHRQATAEQPAAAPELAPAQATAQAPDPSIAFERIARTVRRTIALARKITDPAQPGPAAQAVERRLSARKQIIRAVEDTIQRRTKDAEAEAPHAKLYERLDDPDLDDDLDTLPVVEIIASICRDLGIAYHQGTHPWKRCTPADVRALCARAAGLSTPQPTLAQLRTTQPSTTHPRPGDPRTIPALPPPHRTRTGTGPPGP